MKSKLQPFIIVLGILSLCLGIWQMLQTPTMILPSWFLFLIFLPIVLFIAFILGFLLKILLKSEWNIMTFASVFVVIICSIFYISQYRPTYKIIVPDNYTGEIKLFVSRKGNDFNINNRGVGYIDKRTFEKGFYPKIIKSGKNITEQVKKFNKATYSTSENNYYTFNYFSIEMVEDTVIKEVLPFNEFIEINKIDTTRLQRRN